MTYNKVSCCQLNLFSISKCHIRHTTHMGGLEYNIKSNLNKQVVHGAFVMNFNFCNLSVNRIHMNE